MTGARAQRQGERRYAGVLVARGAFDEGQEHLHRVAAADPFDEIGADATIRVGEEFVHDFGRVDTAAEDLGDFGLNTAVREFRELQQRHGEALGFVEGFEDFERAHDFVGGDFLRPEVLCEQAAQQLRVE